MRLKNKMKRIGALILSAMLMLSGMPLGTMAESTTPTDLQEAIAGESDLPDVPTILPDEPPEDATDNVYSDETESEQPDENETEQDMPSEETPE